jgi:hypothetical protein
VATGRPARKRSPFLIIAFFPPFPPVLSKLREQNAAFFAQLDAARAAAKAADAATTAMTRLAVS